MNDQSAHSLPLPDRKQVVLADEAQRRSDRRRQIMAAIGSLPLVLTIANSALAYGPPLSVVGSGPP